MRVALILGLASLGIAADVCTDQDAANQAIVPKFPKKLQSIITVGRVISDAKAVRILSTLPDLFSYTNGIQLRCDLIDECVLGKEKTAHLRRLTKSDDSAEMYEFFPTRTKYLKEADFPAMFGSRQKYIDDQYQCISAILANYSMSEAVQYFDNVAGTNDFSPANFLERLRIRDKELEESMSAEEQQKLVREIIPRYEAVYRDITFGSKLFNGCAIIAGSVSTPDELLQLRDLKNHGTAEEFEAKFMSNCKKLNVADVCDHVPTCASVLFWKP